MTNAEMTSRADPEVPKYACPFFKADPETWLDNKKCVAYWADDVKGSLCRRHILETHLKLNKGLETSDVRYVDPKIFSDVKQWLKTGGSKRNNDEIWMHVYGMITNTASNGSNFLDPYWTVPWLQGTLASIMQSHGQDTSPNAARLQRTNAYLSTAKHALQTLDQSIAGLDWILNSHGKSPSATIPEDSQGTLGAGQHFSDQHNHTAQTLEVGMIDEHMEEPHQTSSQAQGQHLSNLLNFCNTPLDAVSADLAFDPVVQHFEPNLRPPEQYRPQTSHGSMQTTTAMTPTSSSQYYPPYPYEE